MYAKRVVKVSNFTSFISNERKISKKLEVSNNLLEVAVDLGELGEQPVLAKAEVSDDLLEVVVDLGEPGRELLVHEVEVSDDLLEAVELGEQGRVLHFRGAVHWDHAEQLLLSVSLLLSPVALLSLLQSARLLQSAVANSMGRTQRGCRHGFNQSTITKLISVPVPKPRRPESGAVEPKRPPPGPLAGAGSVEPKRPEPLAGVGAVEPKRPASLAGAGAMEPKRPGAGAVEPKVSCILLEEGCLSEFSIFRSF